MKKSWNDYNVFRLMSVTNLENTETLGNRKMVIKLRRKGKKGQFPGLLGMSEIVH